MRSGQRAPAPSGRRRAAEPEPEPELDVEPEPEPEPEPAPKPRRERAARTRRAKKAAPPDDTHEELDVDAEFAPENLDIGEPDLSIEEEEPLRRARGTGRKGNRPLGKGRRTRSSSR